MTLTMPIKISVAMMSSLVKLVSNQTIDPIAMIGTIIPPGTLKVFSALSRVFILNLIIAKTTKR